MKKLITLAVFFLFMFNDTNAQDENSQVLWNAGVWSGKLPCADCEFISYRLNLKRNLTYEDRMSYNGKKVSDVLSDGTWKNLNDSTVETISGSGNKTLYRIRGNEMLVLDERGEPLQGPSPEMFRLTKLTRGKINPDEMDGINNLFEEKRKNGTDFIASGNEPFWNVEIDIDNKISFTSLTEVGSVSFSSPKFQPIMDIDGVSYSASDETGAINVSIFRDSCVDDMSGLESPFNVTVDIHSKKNNTSTSFSGCGRYLYDPKLNTSWKLRKLEGEEVVAENFKGGVPTMTLDLDAGNISGNAGCNSYRGRIEPRGSKLKFSEDYMMTRMACPNLEFEQRYIASIKGKTLSYEIFENKLTLKDEDKVVMEFEQIP